MSRRTRALTGLVRDPGTVSTFSARTALPYEHLERATAGPRGELRRQLVTDVREMPVWETFAVEGPTRTTDGRGRTWFEYAGTVESRRPCDGSR